MKRQIKYAEYRGESQEKINDLYEKLIKLGDMYYADGFAHPNMIVQANNAPNQYQIMQWGLIPFWTKTLADGQKFWNRTLNARAETMFTKPSYRASAASKRCLIFVDGFYEYHHQAKQTFPFFIGTKESEGITFGGLWSEWTDKETGEMLKTVSIVTVRGNTMLSKIHNNPKLKEPRMPLVISKENEAQWLQSTDKEEVKQLLQPFPTEDMFAYTVKRMKGKNGIGNSPELLEPFEYNELELEVNEWN